MKKPSAEKFRELCTQKGGNCSEIAKSLNCTRAAIYKWMDEDPEFKSIKSDVDESLVDLAETQLINLIKGVPKIDENNKFIGWQEKPDTIAILFTLKTKGKNRGYVEKTEIDHTTKGDKIQQTVIVQDEETIIAINELKAKFED